ncbi:retron system putative HNH endonuclease [Reinekea marinisedimentorum]|uniref:Uncharacterized protein (TIGR02646 family) n=1 Tax=Reinekea marinisedimentorum TaxID=230495 RepID=A0A4R3HYY4_9GAMM|nr:retron system putative HNH endonuclease [Reinekea marinisedimentorum]TCS38084.1 uncharacterized protein (TIGR02646 family) [Reinekea marinisedimentorum]
MRKVNRVSTTQALENKRLNPLATASEAVKAWKRFRSPHKKEIRESFLREQEGLCAYTEILISSSRYGCHIEHIRPKTGYPELTFEPDNLIICSLSDTDLRTINKEEYFGGHYKRAFLDEEKFLFCTECNVNEFIVYLSSGEVFPNASLEAEEIKKAEYTIELLNLNSPVLVHKRKQWIEYIDGEIEFLESSGLDVADFIGGLLEIDQSSGHLQQPFISITQSRFEF